MKLLLKLRKSARKRHNPLTKAFSIRRERRNTASNAVRSNTDVAEDVIVPPLLLLGN